MTQPEPEKPPSLRGYYVPKTLNYFQKAFSFPKATRSAPKISKSPDPSQYNDEYKDNFKKHWEKKVKFLKASKLTIIDDSIKSARLTPGPGQYFVKDSNKVKARKMFTTFGMSERVGFVDDAEYSAEETPPSWNYSPVDVNKKKGKSWAKPRKRKKEVKDPVGPGKYADGVEKAWALTRPVSPATVFSKSRSSSPMDLKVKAGKEVPAVGSYKNLEKAYQNMNFKKDRTPLILPYKSKGFFDDDVKRAKMTPGPGSYNIGPPGKNR